MEALKGVKILDMTHVQSGPTCTQLLAWFGADVVKVERPGVGDATRGQLRDVPEADSLYFTMLNSNKRSINASISTSWVLLVISDSFDLPMSSKRASEGVVIASFGISLNS